MNGDNTEYKCPKCGGLGWFLYKKEVDGMPAPYEFAAACPMCNGEAAKETRKKKKANIPAAFYDAEFKDFDWTIYKDEKGEAIDLSKQQMYVTSFVNDFSDWSKKGIGLYIWSKTRGSGKTFLASAICNTLIKERHLDTKFVSVSALIDMVKDGKDAPKHPIEELCECDVLVLDDLGQQNAGNGWLMDILFRITDSRMQDRKITIVTSNKRLQELDFDDRILDRLNRMLQPIPLPEYCVRARESNTEKMDLFASLGLMKRKEPKPEEAQAKLEVI